MLKLLSMATAKPAEANAHVVPIPAWVAPLGVAKFALAFFVLVLVAAATEIWGGWYAFGITLFTASATLIIGVYYYVSLAYRLVWYNRWAVLTLEIIAVVFWLASFATLAHWTSVFNQGSDYYYSDGYIWSDSGKRDSLILFKREKNKYHVGVVLAGISAGLGAVEFVLFAITLAVFAINLHKHRLNGNPSFYGGAQKPATEVEMTDSAPTERSMQGDYAGRDVSPVKSASGKAIAKDDGEAV